MKNAKFFNKFYTISEALASISLLSVLFTIFKNLNLESIVLFFLLIGLFLLLFINSLGYFGGKKHGYGFSSFVNITSLLTLFFIMLGEIEVYLYLRGFTDIVAVAILQVFLIITVSAVLKFGILNHPSHNT